MIEFLLDNSISLILIGLILNKTINLYSEYFSKKQKPKRIVNVGELYVELSLYRKYTWKTSKYLKNLDLPIR